MATKLRSGPVRPSGSRSDHRHPRRSQPGRQGVDLPKSVHGGETNKQAVTDRDHARAWLPATIAPQETTDVPIEIPLPDAPGRYRLKLDLVSEGIDWFEACGSPTTSRRLLVW